jgi:hypothetical protein
MYKFVSLAVMALLLNMPYSQAQKAPKRPAKTRTAAKPKKTAAQKAAETVVAIADEELLSMDGDKSLYMGKTGDKLVYEVNAGGQTYNFIVTLQKPKNDNYRYSFDWEMTAPASKTGHVDVSMDAALNSSKYINFFKGGNLNLTDASTVWMTGQNFGEMPEKKATMQMDNNAPETFYRKDEAETEQKILFKGKEVKLDIFKIDNDKAGSEHRQLWIQGISSFPLIVRMDMGWTIVLKEIK